MKPQKKESQTTVTPNLNENLFVIEVFESIAGLAFEEIPMTPVIGWIIETYTDAYGYVKDYGTVPIIAYPEMSPAIGDFITIDRLTLKWRSTFSTGIGIESLRIEIDDRLAIEKKLSQTGAAQ